MPSPPGRFSTITGCPQRWLSRSAMRRAPISAPLPAPNVTMNLTGRVGHFVWAGAAAAAMSKPASANPMALAPRHLQIIDRPLSADMVDQGSAVARQRIAAPGDVPVRAYQDQSPLVQSHNLGLVDSDGFQRHGARHCSLLDARCRRIGKSHEHKAATEQVECRATIAKPRMGRAAAGTCGRHIFTDGTPPPQDDTEEYVPSARPGGRAPHAWLGDGRST